MTEVEIDGGMVNGNENLREGANAFFNKIYYEDFKGRPKLDDLNFLLLDDHDYEALEQKFYERDS